MRIERRKDQRHPLVLDLRLTAASGKSEARLSDLSFGGCYIDSICNTSIGEEISFEISVPWLQWVPFRGTVAFAHPGLGFGVSFAPLNSIQEEVVTQLVRPYAAAAVELPIHLQSYAA
jgi:hypothetical protein